MRLAIILLRTGAFAIFALLLAGCESTPRKSLIDTLVENASASTLYQAGSEAFKRWNTHHQLLDLVVADDLFSHALAIHPDNVHTQRMHYQVKSVLAIFMEDYSEATLKAHFDRLNPILQMEVSPPAKTSFMRALLRKESHEVLASHLREAIRQQPKDAYAWYQLAVAANFQEHFWLATAAAKQASELQPAFAASFYLMGDNLSHIDQSRACTDRSPALGKQAISHLAKAVSLADQNPSFLNGAALQYTRMGLYPLAYAQAKKSFALKPNEASARRYAEAAFHLKKYAEVSSAAQVLLNDGDHPEGHLYLALVAASEGNWEEARRHFTGYSQRAESHAYHRLTEHWLAALAQVDGKTMASRDPHASADAATDLPWEQVVADYSASSFDPVSDKQMNRLVDQAADNCQKTEAHFYTAMKYWQQDNRAKAREHLQSTVAQKVPGHYQHLWAKALLAGLY